MKKKHIKNTPKGDVKKDLSNKHSVYFEVKPEQIIVDTDWDRFVETVKNQSESSFKKVSCYVAFIQEYTIS